MSSKKGKVIPPPSEEEKIPKESRGEASASEEMGEAEGTPLEEEGLQEEVQKTKGQSGDEANLDRPQEEKLSTEEGDRKGEAEEAPKTESPTEPDANLECPEKESSPTEGPAQQEEVVIQDVQFDQINPQQSTGKGNNINFLLDVDLPISVQLGKTSMSIQELLEVRPGSVIELDKTVGSPVEILANNKPIAQGEVVVVDENFGVRITSLISQAERIKSLR